MSAQHTAHELESYVAAGNRLTLGAFSVDNNDVVLGELGTQVTFVQTYATASLTHANPTATAHTYPGSGNMFDAVAADLLINVRTDSVANAVADIVINEKSLADNLNQNIADVANVKQVVNSLIDALQAAGIVT
jgi:hypothetical protein